MNQESRSLITTFGEYHDSIVKETQDILTQADCLDKETKVKQLQIQRLNQQIEFVRRLNGQLADSLARCEFDKADLINGLQELEKRVNDKKINLEQRRRQYPDWLKENSSGQFMKTLNTKVARLSTRFDEASKLALDIEARMRGLLNAQGLPEEELERPVKVSSQIKNYGSQNPQLFGDQKDRDFYY